MAWLKSKTIEQAKFAYSPWGKAFEKQKKTIEEQAEKQIKNNWRPWRKANKDTWKQSQKNVFRHRSKINCFFIYKRFSKWRSYIRIKQLF